MHRQLLCNERNSERSAEMLQVADTGETSVLVYTPRMEHSGERHYFLSVYNVQEIWMSENKERQRSIIASISSVMHLFD